MRRSLFFLVCFISISIPLGVEFLLLKDRDHSSDIKSDFNCVDMFKVTAPDFTMCLEEVRVNDKTCTVQGKKTFCDGEVFP